MNTKKPTLIYSKIKCIGNETNNGCLTFLTESFPPPPNIQKYKDHLEVPKSPLKVPLQSELQAVFVDIVRIVDLLVKK